MTTLPHPNPLGLSKNTFFDLPTGEGAPSKVRGLGEFLRGVWGRVPQWVWAKPKVLVGNADSPAGHTTYEYKSSVLDL